MEENRRPRRENPDPGEKREKDGVEKESRGEKKVERKHTAGNLTKGGETIAVGLNLKEETRPNTARGRRDGGFLVTQKAARGRVRPRMTTRGSACQDSASRRRWEPGHPREVEVNVGRHRTNQMPCMGRDARRKERSLRGRQTIGTRAKRLESTRARHTPKKQEDNPPAFQEKGG